MISRMIIVLTTAHHSPAKCCMRSRSCPLNYICIQPLAPSCPCAGLSGIWALIAALAERRTSSQPEGEIQPVCRSAGGALLLWDTDLLDNFTAVSAVMGQDKWLTPQWLSWLLGKSRTGSHCACVWVCGMCQCSIYCGVSMFYSSLPSLSLSVWVFSV